MGVSTTGRRLCAADMQLFQDSGAGKKCARRLLLGVAVAVVFTLAGCGGGSKSTTPPTTTVFVTISPVVATLAPGATQQFSDVVQNTTNTAVTWQVNGVTGGDAVHGTVSSAGLYTAPAVIPTPSSVTVSAVSVADTGQSGSATVTIAAPIAINPATASVAAGGTQQFSAQISFSSDTAVTWEVNGIAGGNSTVGTISTAGLYTAPSTFPVPTGITVKAVAHADSSKSATASVTIIPPTIAISPSTITLSAGTQQKFTASVLNNAITPDWSVQCGTSGSCGSIAADGTYTAPLSPPVGGTVTVTASVSNGAATTSSAIVTVQLGSMTLSGSYVFAFSSTASNYAGEAGVITLDGNGNITAGQLDNGADGGTPITISGGTYTVGTDGRGSVSLQVPAGTITWHFALANHNGGFAVRDDAANVAASGTFELQQPSQIATLNGNYAFQLSGASSGNATLQAGALHADGSGSVTHALVDVTTAPSTVAPTATPTGSYIAPAANGRGTLTLGTQVFAYYQADARHLVLVETDGSRTGAGQLVAQPAGPFSTAALSGKYSFTLQGSNSGPYAIGGVFTADGNGAVSNRILDGFNLPTQLNSTGSYTVTDSAQGRTLLTWTNGNVTSSFALYPLADGSFNFLEFDGANIAAGTVRPVSSSFLTVQSLSGGFALQLSGALANSTGEFIVGQLVLPGGSTFSGTLDVTDGGVLNSGAAITGSLQPTDVNTGKGLAVLAGSSAALGNARWNLYMLDDSHVLLLDSASDRVLTGSLVRQY